MVRKQTTYFITLGTVLLFLLAACNGVASLSTPTLPLTASLRDLQGTVELWNPGEVDFVNASAGDVLEVQGHVRTGSDGRLRLDLSTGTIIRVAPDSLFTLVSNEPQSGSLLTRLILQAGQVWIILNGGQMEVQTPSGVASVRGSYMSVWVDPETSDVWVSCLEGWCQAGNSSAVLDLVASQGATLFSFDPQGTIPPPPPLLRSLSQEEIDTFLENNPEAEQIMDAVIATASALPPLPPSATPTQTGTCFEALAPDEAAVLPTASPQVFSWSEQPGRYKYVLSIFKPNGTALSEIVWENSFSLPAGMLTQEGMYHWQVTAYDAAIQPICTTARRTFSLPASPSPTTGTPGACAALLNPVNAASLPASGEVTFTWTVVPGAAKYIFNLKSPTGTISTTTETGTSHVQKLDLLVKAGTYEWWVTAKNNNLDMLCSSNTFTFTKAAFSNPTKTATATLPPGGVDLFWDRVGPTGTIASCDLYFSVNTNPPQGGMVKVVLSSNPIPDGNSDPHVVMGNSVDTKYTAGFKLGDLGNFAAGTLVYWRFAIFSSGYTHDSTIYSFVSPGCPFEPANTPTTFVSISDPGSVVTTCPVQYSVNATDPEGLQHVKVQYKVFDTASNLVVNGDYTHLTYNAATSLWQGDVTFNGLQAGYSVTWWIWAIDNAGNSTFSATSAFTYTP